MLAQLLSSKPKSKLINLFLANPRRSFSATELRVTAGIGSALLKKTLKELVRMEFILASEKRKHRFYQVNHHFALYPELLNTLRRNKNIPKDLLASSALKSGECKFIALTGVFTGKPRIETDVLFVGKVMGRRFQNFLKLAEKFAEQEINYTVFTGPEFEYRQIMNDRFLKNILENNPVIVLDKKKVKNVSR